MNKAKFFSQDYSFSIKIYITSPTVSGILFNYKDFRNFDQLILIKSQKNSEFTYQRIREGKLTEKQSKIICEKNSLNKYNDCIPLDFKNWYIISILNYQKTTIIQINDKSIGNYKQTVDYNTNDGYSFGMASFAGNQVYYTDIEYSLINFPQKLKNTVFGSINDKMKPVLSDKFNNQQKNLKPNNDFLGFSFKENQKNDKNNDGESIENIKLDCLKFQGSEESCTQAMIAYDELLTKKHGQEIDDEEISRIVYKKCLDFEGNSPLGCSFAYKKALEVHNSHF